MAKRRGFFPQPEGEGGKQATSAGPAWAKQATPAAPMVPPPVQQMPMGPGSSPTMPGNIDELLTPQQGMGMGPQGQPGAQGGQNPGQAGAGNAMGEGLGGGSPVVVLRLLKLLGQL